LITEVLSHFATFYRGHGPLLHAVRFMLTDY
jgi:hypothetical protein